MCANLLVGALTAHAALLPVMPLILSLSFASIADINGPRGA
ncbi:hypothetical protein ABH945_005220 [Paraburkholderia sp. GAS333]